MTFLPDREVRPSGAGTGQLPVPYVFHRDPVDLPDIGWCARKDDHRVVPRPPRQFSLSAVRRFRKDVGRRSDLSGQERISHPGVKGKKR